MTFNMPVVDLLFAHGMLCHWAEVHRHMGKEEAERLCSVINSFQIELEDYLIPNSKAFHVVKTPWRAYRVEPIGGWNYE